LYHHLFENLTPDEIIVNLVRDYWNNQSDWVEKALLRLEDVKKGE